jgi:hypothetical protein
MAKSVYQLVGRLALRAVWLIYGRRIKLAGAAAIALLAVTGSFLAARRQPPEG